MPRFEFGKKVSFIDAERKECIGVVNGIIVPSCKSLPEPPIYYLAPEDDTVELKRYLKDPPTETLYLVNLSPGKGSWWISESLLVHPSTA